MGTNPTLVFSAFRLGEERLMLASLIFAVNPKPKTILGLFLYRSGMLAYTN